MVSETVSTFDCEMMSKAIQLAQKAIYSCPPNPAVGCVICREGDSRNFERRADSLHVLNLL